MSDLNVLYELLQELNNLNLNFFEIYSELDETEQLNFYEYIEFLKTNPTKEEFLKYIVSQNIINYLIDFIKVALIQTNR